MKQVVVIAGPSGGGKNSIIHALIERHSRCSRLVTATTRAPRPGEQDGVDYHFLPEEKFLAELAAGNILEHRFIEKLGTHYGVYKPDLEARLQRGDIALAHLDIVGACYLKEHYGAITIFILPESVDVLEARVRGRNPGMSEEEIRERMRIATIEIEEHALEYDYRVVNAQGKLVEAVDEVESILEKEGYQLEL